MLTPENAIVDPPAGAVYSSSRTRGAQCGRRIDHHARGQRIGVADVRQPIDAGAIAPDHAVDTIVRVELPPGLTAAGVNDLLIG